jgi:tRNA pseudouridine32 synthase/23S rRNA pseudouridine746 synthase
MASLGAPILNDPLYPELASGEEDDFDAPLKLLAKRLSFSDPLCGRTRRFESRLTL